MNATAGTRYSYRVSASNTKGTTVLGTVAIEAADTPVIFEEDFEPEVDAAIGTRVEGGRVVLDDGKKNHVYRMTGAPGEFSPMEGDAAAGAMGRGLHGEDGGTG